MRTPAYLLIVGLLALSVTSFTTLAQEGEGDESEQPAGQCDEIFTDDVDLAYYVGQGDVYFARGDYTTAIALYTCALEIDPEYADVYVQRGYAFATQRNDPAALEDYNRALEIAPDSVEAYNNRGVLYTLQGSFAPALADFELALALNPDYVVAYHNRGAVHAIEGNYDLALADFNHALELDPDFAEAHAAIGAVYLALALQSYNAYWQQTSTTTIPPGGDPAFTLTTLREAQVNGTFSAWLSLQLPAR